MIRLLDVSVLIALIDRRHAHHDLASAWFDPLEDEWATCPITQNGVLRILQLQRYPSGAFTPSVIMASLRSLIEEPAHRFWPDDLSLIDSDIINAEMIVRSNDVTDTYLLALAAKHGGRLATLDRRLRTNAVIGGADALELIA